jgi:hypothetical protein
MSSPTNEIKARAKLPSMPFPYLVTLLILLPFILFRKHSGLALHHAALIDGLNMAHSEMRWEMGFSALEIAYLRRSLIPNFFVRGGTLPSRSPRSGLRPSVRAAPWMNFHDIGLLSISYLTSLNGLSWLMFT